MDAIIRVAIDRRHLVLVLASALVAVGTWQARQARFDALPDFTPPRVVVQTEAPGLGSAEVEAQVTAPLERLLLGVPKGVSVRSTSSAGLSLIEVLFEDKTDIFRARQLVRERLAAIAGRLPRAVDAPALTPISAPVGALLKFCYSPKPGDPKGMATLWRFAQWTLRPRLLSIRGISRVTVHGGDAPRLEVQPDVAALAARGITLDTLAKAVASAQSVLPSGFVEGRSQRQPLRVAGSFAFAQAKEAIAALVVAQRGGLPIRVRDVARVVLGHRPPVGSALYNGRPALYVQVDKLPWADTLEVTRRLEAALKALDRELPSGVRRRAPVFVQSRFIRQSLGALARAMALGAGLVVLTLLFFLRSWRLSLVSLAAIPLSLLAAVAVLVARGASVNGMILGGLAIATGEVVDDAIVDVENIWRRLRENAKRETPRRALSVIHDASIEVRGSVVYATAVIIVVLSPVMLLGGLTGHIFSPLAQAYALAMGASLLVALTVTPALSALLLPGLALSEIREGKAVRVLRRAYRALLLKVASRPRAISLAAAGLGLAALVAIPLIGGGYLPEFREGVLIAELRAWPGTSLQETARLAADIQLRLLKAGLVRETAARVGRASLDEDASPVHRVEMDLVLPPGAGDPEDVAARVARTMAQTPGLRFAIEGFLGERINELLAGERRPVAIKLRGSDLPALRAAAREAARVAETIPGLQGVRADALADISTVDLPIDDQALATWGLDRAAVVRAAAIWRQGLFVTRVRAPGGFSVPVVLAEGGVGGPKTPLKDIALFSPRGAVIPMSAVTSPVLGHEPALIRHVQGQRVVTVTARVKRGALVKSTADLARKLRSTLGSVKGLSWKLAGQAVERRTVAGRLLWTVALVLIAGLILLYLAFGSLRDAAVVLFALPLGVLGGVLAALLLPEGISMAGLVGFVTLSGIISRNGIMLVAHKNALYAEDPKRPPREIVIQAAEERLVPIFMTAGTAFLGLLPLALSLEQAGSELEAPMAIIVCAGLLTATVLNLIAIPAFYFWRDAQGVQVSPGSTR